MKIRVEMTEEEFEAYLEFRKGWKKENQEIAILNHNIMRLKELIFRIVKIDDKNKSVNEISYEEAERLINEASKV